MESGPTSRVVASIRPAGSSDRRTGGFSSTTAPSQPLSSPSSLQTPAPLPDSRLGFTLGICAGTATALTHAECWVSPLPGSPCQRAGRPLGCRRRVYSAYAAPGMVLPARACAGMRAQSLVRGGGSWVTAGDLENSCLYLVWFCWCQLPLTLLFLSRDREGAQRGVAT